MGPHGLLISQNMGKIPDFYKSMNIKMRLVIIKNRYFLLFSEKVTYMEREKCIWSPGLMEMWWLA